MDLNQQDVFIFNSLNKSVSVKAFGNYFTFKPLQIKRMRPEIGGWLEQQKGYMGFVTLPAEFDEPSYKDTEEGKAILEAKRVEGVNKRIMHLKSQVNNLQVALVYDLNVADMKADINTFATEGDIEAMDELLAYQREQNDVNKQRSEAARIKLRQLQSAQNAEVNRQKIAPAASHKKQAEQSSDESKE